MNCQGCGAALPAPTRPGRRRKWCTERCRRQTLYGGTCEVCGAPTNGSDGPGKAAKRCVKHAGDEAYQARVDRTRPKYERMVALWNAGVAVDEIATELGTTAKTVRAQLYRLRCRGWDVAHRRTEEQVRNISEGRFGHREPAYTFGALTRASAASEQARKRP